MRKFAPLVFGAGLLLASCSGHNGAASLPSTATGGGVRPASVNVAPAGWASTATLALADASHAVGTLDSAKTITISVGLQLRNVDQAKAAIAGGQTLDQATFIANNSPTDAQVSQVRDYLTGQGFTNITVAPNNLLVDATGTVAQVQKAFNTSLGSFTQNGLPVYANTSPAYVPSSLGGIAVAVLGLNNLEAARTGPNKPAPADTPDKCKVGSNGLCARFYDVATFHIAYDVGNTPAGSRTAIGIFTVGKLDNAISEFRFNEQKQNLPTVPLSVVNVGTSSADTSGDGEWIMDMTHSTGMAGNVKHLYLYNAATLSDSDIIHEYNRWTSDNLAKVGSSSFGGCEVFPYLSGGMLMADMILTQAAAQGQTMFVSSGDNGGFCNNLVNTNGVPGGAPFVEWPASSPYVVAVGGTDLFSNPDGTYLGEAAWEGGGGGISQFEYSPYWETPEQPVGNIPTGGRGVPDVAMDGSIETAGIVYSHQVATNGGTCENGCTAAGTSLSAPLAAGVYTRLQSAHYNKLGFGAVALYKIYAQNPNASQTSLGPAPTQLVGGFHDILGGSNGAYTSKPRYDYTTGLGSFDVAKTNALIGQ